MDGATALHNASQNGHLELVDLLLTRGANIDALGPKVGVVSRGAIINTLGPKVGGCPGEPSSMHWGPR